MTTTAKTAARAGRGKKNLADAVQERLDATPERLARARENGEASTRAAAPGSSPGGAPPGPASGRRSGGVRSQASRNGCLEGRQKPLEGREMDDGNKLRAFFKSPWAIPVLLLVFIVLGALYRSGERMSGRNDVPVPSSSSSTQTK